MANLPPASPYTAQQVWGGSAAASGAISGIVTLYSDWVDCSSGQTAAFAMAWSGGAGSPAAVWGLQGELDDDAAHPVVGPVNISLTTAPTAVSGASGTTGLDVGVTGWRRLRLALTPTSGTFNLAALAFVKPSVR